MQIVKKPKSNKIAPQPLPTEQSIFPPIHTQTVMDSRNTDHNNHQLLEDSTILVDKSKVELVRHSTPTTMAAAIPECQTLEKKKKN